MLPFELVAKLLYFFRTEDNFTFFIILLTKILNVHKKIRMSMKQTD